MHSVKEILAYDASHWERRIAADLSSELESQLAEGTPLLEMRRFLAVKGFRELRRRLENDLAGKSGELAVRALAICMRSFAHDRPGLSAAAFRSPATDSPEWRQEGELLGRLCIEAFQSAGLGHDRAIEALQILRALVRGFVLHEMAASFLDDVDYDKSYSVAVAVFVRGLDELRSR